MTAVVHIAGLTLLHFLWQGALIALAAAILLRLMRHASPQTRYISACIALTAMLAAPIVTIRVLSTPAAVEVTVRKPPATLRIEAIPRGTTGVAMDVAERPGRSPMSLNQETLPVVVGIWAAGVVILLARLAGGWWRVRLRHQAALTMTASRWQATVERTAAVLGLRRHIRCVDSSLVDTPTVIGWLRPVILLPIAALTNLTPGQAEAILAHELAHIRRHDYLVNLLQHVTETLLFYHPGVWWLSSRIRAEREHCCDEVAVSMHGDAVGYAAALTELESWRTKSPSLAVAATGGSLLGRVQRVLRLQDDRNPTSSNAILTTALILLIVVAGGSRYVPAQAENAAPSMAVQAAPPTNWQTHETPHFDVLYAEGAKPDVEAIARDLERAYDRAGQARDALARERARLQAMHDALRLNASELRLSASQPSPSVSDFEVASVKPNRGENPATVIRSRPESFNATNITLRALIRLAFQVQDSQIVGGPGWLNSDRFDVDARSGGTPNPDQQPAMMRAPLIERFRLKTHSEARDLPVFALRVTRTDGTLGPQLQPSGCGRDSAAPGPPESKPGRPCNSIQAGLGRISVKGIPMSQVATALSPLLSRVVADRTGLTANFDFDLQWTPDWQPTAALDVNGVPSIDPNGPSIETALQEQLGLKIEADRQSTNVLVIDSAEPLTGN